MRTGKGRSEGQAFHRRLLSEYNTEITLDNYVSYFQLKPIAKAVEQLRKEIEKRKSAAETTVEVPVASPTMRDSVAITVEESVGSGVEAINELMESREALQDEFFIQLRASFVKVRDYLGKLENELVLRVKDLKQLTEDEIRARPEQHIPQLYVTVQSVQQYRVLNLAAFRKIMKKFMERCACDSLELQQRLMKVDDIISRSSLSHPRLDLRRIALDLIALYGTVYRLTYEETVAHLSRYEHKEGVNIRRILPHSDTFFFTLNFPHQERQGDFAVRILPGSTSLFCEKMICEVLQCERYPPCCTQFPNGEINVRVSRTLRGDDVFVLQSLVKCDHVGLSHSGALMELALMIHTAKLSSAKRVTAVIPYLAYTSSVSSMAVVAELLETMGCQHVITVDLSSEQVEGMFSVPMETISARYEFVRYIANQLTNEGHDFRNITIVATTGTSVNRAKNFADALMRYKKLSREEQFVSVCTAVQRHVVPQERNNNNNNNNNQRPLLRHNNSYIPTVEEIQKCKELAANMNEPVGHTEEQNEHDLQKQRDLYNLSTPMSDYDFSFIGNSSTRAFENALRQQEAGVNAIRNPVADSFGSTDGVVLVGDVKDKLCIIVDTAIDEAIYISRTARKLREEGASRIILIATHFILSGEAVERLINSPIDLVVVTDSVDQDEVFKNPRIAQKLRVLPIAPLLARAIEKMHTENTLTTLFEK
ncbi:putative ribose-phosphate pyrophosphokinase [Trypanosoma theileri]|uniref:Putative ribose-phosphate pyrophosphokinase n=1 Tax=Trypanosoma theileri TaxID=67003 RepID=A0A1X0NPK7_9TRYP|nr:putative ribose-phosphate pyrophosphokinase [Trypanosoma theileri]ORC86458.1 putative ribose-phosphate pyrophosphokinase [Trypanosoma theileri]